MTTRETKMGGLTQNGAGTTDETSTHHHTHTPGTPHPTSGHPSDERFVREVVNTAVRNIIGNQRYDHRLTDGWCNGVVKDVVQALVGVDRGYKYIVTCTIIEKTGSGIRSATSCFWNAATDRGYSVECTYDDMHVFATIYCTRA